MCYFLPAFSNTLPSQVTLKSQLTKNIALNIPLLSSAMDTVTEARLAIAIAQEGGMGIVHKNMTIEQQAREVRAVKKFESGIIRDPVTIYPEASLKALYELTQEHGISGVPVVSQGKLAGIITSRDLRFESRTDALVKDVMTPRERLVTALEGTDFEQITTLLHDHKLEKVLLINEADELTGMITVKDIVKAQAYPMACKDAQGQLRVGASVGTSADTDTRIAALVDAGVDVVVVDTAHGHSQGVLDRVAWIKEHYPNLDVIGGNVATKSGAQALIDAGADAVKVGIGPGSICTTRIVAGVGVPQITAISEAAEVATAAGAGNRRRWYPLLRRYCQGNRCRASAIMVGSLLAGTDESPGEVELYQGRTYKSYRGMGSLGAMDQQHGSSDRYFQEVEGDGRKLVPEGVEGRVAYKGAMGPIVHQLMGGLRASMGYTGSVDIDTMRTQPEFVRVSSAAMVESHVHDITITREAPNYPVS